MIKGWIAHDGKGTPCDGSRCIEVRLHNVPDEQHNFKPVVGCAWSWDWPYDKPSYGDIVKWRYSEVAEENPPQEPKHSHYFKDVRGLNYIDVYRVLSLFNVTSPCLQHAIKKLLVAGGRGAGKDVSQDVQEAIDSLVRWMDMQEEDAECTSKH